MTHQSKTWREKRDLDKPAKRVRVAADFAGIPANQMMLVATPRMVDAWLRRIPRGETRTIERLRRELARSQGCDATCPVSLAIFLRICAEAAWEEIESGTPVEDVAPFWRVIEPGSKIAKKLCADPRFIEARRELECGTTGPGEEGPGARKATRRSRSKPAGPAGASRAGR